jgi:hypothetical protein
MIGQISAVSRKEPALEPVSETEDAWIAHGTAVEYPDAMREASREAARLLASE